MCSVESILTYGAIPLIRPYGGAQASVVGVGTQNRVNQVRLDTCLGTATSS